MREPAGFHYGLNVGKVQINQRGHGDQIADALNALAKHIVRDAESLQHRGALSHDLQEPVVGDHNERIHPLL